MVVVVALKSLWTREESDKVSPKVALDSFIEKSIVCVINKVNGMDEDCLCKNKIFIIKRFIYLFEWGFRPY